MGFLAVWCQFAMTIFYYPSLLGFVASTLAYVFNPACQQRRVDGVRDRGRLLVRRLGLLARHQGRGRPGQRRPDHRHPDPGRRAGHPRLVFLGQGNPSAAPMDASNLLPAWAGLASLVLIVNNFLSYSGMEMNAVHVSSLENPAKEFPKSMFLAMGLVLVIFILPALAISWIVPAEELSLTAGVMQAFDAVFANFGSQWLTPIVGIMLVAASLGGMLTWLAGPSKGLLLISRQEGYLPPFLQKLNKNGVQQNILVVQGLVTTVIALGYALIPDVSSAYWIFSVITTQVYLIMYLLMFVAAVRLRRKDPDHPRGYRAPMLVGLCGVGFAASLAALLVGFIPPSQFESGNGGVYFLDRRRRRARPRAARAVPLLQVPQAVLEAARAGGGEPVMSTSRRLRPARPHGHLHRGRGRLVLLLVVCLVLLPLGASEPAGPGEGRPVHRGAREAGSAPPVAGADRPRARRRRRRGLREPEPARCARRILFSQLTNGAAGPGTRPVIADSRIVMGQLLIIKIYCPDELPSFQKFVDNLKTATCGG